MPDTAIGDAASEDRPHWRRRLIVGVLLLLVLGVGYVLWWYQSSLKRLERAMADADRLDPGWRFEELQAKRAAIPDDQNSALVVLSIGNSFAKLGPWSTDEAQQLLESRTPPVQLSAEQTNVLRGEFEGAAVGLTRARRLLNLPRGRFPVAFSGEQVAPVRGTIRLLEFDATLRAQDGDIDGALQSCRAMMNAARSLGDEPTAIAVLVRIALRAVALQHVERVLAQGQASETELLAMQRLLEEEAREPLLLTIARGERARCHEIMRAVKAGQSGSLGHSLDGRLLEDARSPLAWLNWNNDHAAILEDMNRYVELARLPLQQQAEPMKELDTRLRDRDQPDLARMLIFPLTQRVFEAIQRFHAVLECSIVALAAERYRLVHGRWPDSLEQLTPKFLSKVPDDPYGKGPIRLGKVNDGLVIYSVYIDGVDNGGKVVPNVGPIPGIDLGVRLWDVKARRQPAPAKAAGEVSEFP